MTLFSGMMMGASLQYNWAWEHNFWNDFQIRIILGPIFFSIILLISTGILNYFLVKSKRISFKECFQKLSISSSAFAFSGLIFFNPDYRYKIFIISLVLFLGMIIFFFSKDIGILFRKIFPICPVSLDYGEKDDSITIKIRGIIVQESISYLYQSLNMEEDSLFEKKVLIDLTGVEKIDERGYYWLIFLISKAKMSGVEFEIKGEPPIFIHGIEKKLNFDLFAKVFNLAF
jgi:anti-anti-sigma regulatory factor